MTLSLTILRCPDSVPPETRTVAGGEFSIGRGSENDWVLPDPDRHLSKRHCVLAYRSGGWRIADFSTNGTFLNRESEALGRGGVRDLRDGDRVNLGSYEIEIRIDAAAAPAPRPAAADPFDLDPFAPRPDAPLSGRDLLLGAAPAPAVLSPGFAPAAINLPADYDPLAPDDDEPGAMAPAGPVRADHSPHLSDAFAGPTAHAVLPDDWDRDFAARPAAPEPLPPVAPPPAPAGFAPAPPAAVAPAAVVPAPAPAGDLLAAFARGAGLDDLRPADPAALMEALGAAMREVVHGLRQAMIGRAAIKGEFRIEQTVIRSRGNNPLKFSADDDDALDRLLLGGRRSDVSIVDAVGETLRDIRLHELATVSAMQTAVRALLAEFEPGALLRAAAEGGLALVPVQRKARAWDRFETLYARMSAALADNFDSSFGKAFARAYERALAEASARESEQ